MAMQTAGIGLSRIIILAGAGYTGTVLVQKGKLSDLIGELQAFVKGIEKSGEQSEGDEDLAQQVKHLMMELRQYASPRQITVLNSGQSVDYSGLILPAATLGALGYGYMWWKGLKLSDFMYVTKRNVENAVSNLKKHLEQVCETVSAAKKHLTQRIQLLDDKMETQKEISKAIQNDVNTASENLSHIGSELGYLHNFVYRLGGRMNRLEENQDLANMGILYLCNFVGSGNKFQLPKALEDQLKPSGKPRSLTYYGVDSPTGLKALTGSLLQTVSDSPTVVSQDGVDIQEAKPKASIIDHSKLLSRFNSTRC